MELLEILKDNEIFKGLNDEEVKEVAGICYKKEYKNGSIIFEENSKGSEMYILIEGKVDIQMSMGIASDLATVHIIEAGEIFGELTLVDRGLRSATTKAAGDAVAFILEADKFERLINDNYRIGYIVMRNIARIVSTRLRERNIKYTESLIWERLSSKLE
jgi:CRP/FNR family cyclic AMP-dependent transcriptional regulator